MKFGSKLRAYAIPEWRAAYIRYGALKALIKRYQRELAAAEYRHNLASQTEIQRSLQTPKGKAQEERRKEEEEGGYNDKNKRSIRTGGGDTGEKKKTDSPSSSFTPLLSESRLSSSSSHLENADHL